MSLSRSEQIADLLLNPDNLNPDSSAVRIIEPYLRNQIVGGISFEMSALNRYGRGQLRAHFLEELSRSQQMVDGIYTLSSQDPSFFRRLASAAAIPFRDIGDRDTRRGITTDSLVRSPALLLITLGIDRNPLELICALANKSSVSLLVSLADYQTPRSEGVKNRMGAENVTSLTTFEDIISSPFFPEEHKELAQRWWTNGLRGY